MALCQVGNGPEGLRFLGGGQSNEKSLLRANRSLLDQCCAILFCHPLVRACCLVSLNDTLEEIELHRYRYLRPGRWSFDPQSGQLCFLSASQVKATLAAPPVQAAFELLAAGPTVYEDLASRMLSRQDCETEHDIRAVLDHLISLGALLLLPPWPTYEPHLEKRIYQLLSELSPNPTLYPILTTLERLLQLESNYPEEAEPECASQALRSAISSLLEAVLQPWGNDLQSTYQMNDRHWLYEDVFLFSDAKERELIEISSHTLEEVMTTADVLFRFTYLHSHRHDVLHNLAALWKDIWQDQREIGALELFFGLKYFWSRYSAFDLANRDRLFSSFNPMDLTSVRELDELRTTIYKGTQDLMREGQAGWNLDPGHLAECPASTRFEGRRQLELRDSSSS